MPRGPSPGSLLTALETHLAGLSKCASAAQMDQPQPSQEDAAGERGSQGSPYAQLGGHMSLGRRLLTPADALSKRLRILSL